MTIAPLPVFFSEFITCWMKQVYIAMLSFFFAGIFGTPAQNRAGWAAIFSRVSEKSILNGGLETT